MPEIKKTECPISRKQFDDNAEELEATVSGKSMIVPVKEFKTGSLGWYNQQKITVEVDGKKCLAQCTVSLQIVGSKALPKENEAEAAD
jgi:hypothetical protein